MLFETIMGQCGHFSTWAKVAFIVPRRNVTRTARFIRDRTKGKRVEREGRRKEENAKEMSAGYFSTIFVWETDCCGLHIALT